MSSSPWAVVILPAELDLRNCAQARAELIAAAKPGSGVIADMTAVTFCDSAAVAALIGANSDITAAGGELRLVITETAVLRIFNVTGADQVMRVFGSLDDARQSGGY